MKAILIDSVNKELKYVYLDDKSVLREWYRHIGCNYVCIGHYLDDKHTILVDDEGAINGTTSGFVILYNGQHLFGNGLVVCNNDEGDSVDVTISIEELDTICPIVWFNTIK